MNTVLVTGAEGFIGRNLVHALCQRENVEVITCHRATSSDDLERSVRQANVVIHLAGVNRPPSDDQFDSGNVGFTETLCDLLAEYPQPRQLMFASSIQAECDNPYGNSKRGAEEVLKTLVADSDTAVSIFRLPNVFGKWSRPNYNSAIATFCHNLARDQPIQVTSSERTMSLVYIDDVVTSFIDRMDHPQTGYQYATVDPVEQVTLGELADMLKQFRASRDTLQMPSLGTPLARKLYATYLSFLPETGYAYPLQQREDQRGVLAEFIKSSTFGQIFVSRTKPGITRGNHYHHTKTEKFMVLSGQSKIRFRHVLGDEVLEYAVTGEDMRVVDIPPGYTHSIENVGESEMVVLFWASEVFNQSQPDTYFESVIRETEGSDESCNGRRNAA